MQTKKGLIKYLILILSIAIFIGIFIFSLNDIDEILGVLKETNYKYILIAIGLLLIYVIGCPLAIMTILYYRKEKIKPFDAFCVSASEFFFRGVTPFNAGGEPMQIYGFNCCGVKPAKSTPVILMNFAVFQIITNITCIITFIVYGKQIRESLNNLIYIIIIGFIVNIACMLLLLFAMSKKMSSIALRFSKWLSTKKLFKKLLSEKGLASEEQFFVDMSEVSHEIVKNWPVIVINAVIKIIALAAYNAIPFFVFKAIGLDLGYEQFVFTMLLTVFAMTMLIWIPTPGASGGIEFVFTTIFASFGATGAKAVSGMLIWRFLTYYLLLIIGFVCYLIFSKRRKKYENRNIH